MPVWLAVIRMQDYSTFSLPLSLSLISLKTARCSIVRALVRATSKVLMPNGLPCRRGEAI